MSLSDTPDGDDAGALEGLLRWYLAMGVDAALAPETQNRFELSRSAMDAAQSPPPRPSALRPETSETPPQPRRLATAMPADALVLQAEKIAAAAPSIGELRRAWQEFDGCKLAETAARMILAGGNSAAKIMILAAAPGSDDERHGAAFAGMPGQLLDRMLGAIGLSRDNVYLANVIPWRPPGNRAPTPLEAALCLPFTRRHIALADPSLILSLGERAAQLLLDTKDPLSRLRGRWLSYEGETHTRKLAVTFSLDYLLSQPLQKKRAWQDLLAFSKMIPTEP